MEQPIFDSDLFSYKVKHNSFGVEISSLPHSVCISKGFGIRLCTTGKVISFKYVNCDRHERENEILCWNFKITKESAKENPQMFSATAVIFND